MSEKQINEACADRLSRNYFGIDSCFTGSVTITRVFILENLISLTVWNEQAKAETELLLLHCLS